MKQGRGTLDRQEGSCCMVLPELAGLSEWGKGRFEEVRGARESRVAHPAIAVLHSKYSYE